MCFESYCDWLVTSKIDFVFLAWTLRSWTVCTSLLFFRPNYQRRNLAMWVELVCQVCVFLSLKGTVHVLCKIYYTRLVTYEISIFLVQYHAKQFFWFLWLSSFVVYLLMTFWYLQKRYCKLWERALISLKACILDTSFIGECCVFKFWNCNCRSHITSYSLHRSFPGLMFLFSSVRFFPFCFKVQFPFCCSLSYCKFLGFLRSNLELSILSFSRCC